MTNIYILERFVPVAEIEKSLAEMRELLVKADTDDAREAINRIIVHQEQQLESGEGHWEGYEGKINYKQFVQCAVRCIKSCIELVAEGRLLSSQFRVLKTELKDDTSKIWLHNYVQDDSKESVGIVRYLFTQV